MYTIYALVDPRNHDIRYVGITKDVVRRYIEHTHINSHLSPKDKWVEELRNRGLSVKLEILEQTAELEREAYWINYCISEGYKLFNDGVRYHRDDKKKGTKICCECGNEITGKSVQRTTCSNKCRTDRSRRLKRQRCSR